MKQILLSLIMLGTGLIYAQTFSFEQSENFFPGDINGQNAYWESTPLTSGGNIPGQNITNAQASDGTQSLLISHLPEYGPQSSPLIGAVYTPATPIPWVIGTTISFDFYGTLADGTGSDFHFQLVDFTAQSYITYFNFNYEGNVQMVGNSTSGEGQVHPTTGTWTANAWHNLRMEYQEDGLMHLFLNDVEVSTGAPFLAAGAANIEVIRLFSDNYGGNAYYDNIVINGNLSTNDINAARTVSSIYPNPVKDIVNVRLAEDFNTSKTTATLVNMTGMKVAQFSSVNNINVANLPTGMYILTLTDGIKTENKKLIKK